MLVKEINDNLIVRLEIGEDVVESLLKIGEDYDVKFAEITGIGASDSIEIGYYNVNTKEYKSKEFTGDLEITSLMGNLSRQIGKPYLHLHINFSDDKLNVYGGHLNKAIISATCEIVIRKLDEEVSRVYHEESGLNVFDI